MTRGCAGKRNGSSSSSSKHKFLCWLQQFSVFDTWTGWEMEWQQIKSEENKRIGERRVRNVEVGDFIFIINFHIHAAISLCCAQQWTLAAFIKNCAQLQKITKWTFVSLRSLLFFSSSFCSLFGQPTRRKKKFHKRWFLPFEVKRGLNRKAGEKNCVWSQLGI